MTARILVVDDDPDIRDTVIEVLEEHGLRAQGAANGAEALRALRDDPVLPRLILLDLMMPGMDGRAFRAAQLADPVLAQIPVVVISAFRDSAETAQQLGAAGHLTKPVSLDDLLAIIERLTAPS